MTITIPADLMDSLGDASAPAQAVLDRLVGSVSEWQRVVKTEQSKRRKIAAVERMWLAAIETDRQFLMTYLDRSFDERAVNFRALFDDLDRAMAGDGSQVTDILAAITTLALRSPFDGLKDADTVTAKLCDSKMEW
jgi:hypothetical protein